MITDTDKIPLEQCVRGRVYEIRSRNLAVGVYDGKCGFIGIRTKFGSRYLFTEYHWDQGSPHGTVSRQRDLGYSVPDGVEPSETTGTGTYDGTTGRSLVWSREVFKPN